MSLIAVVVLWLLAASRVPALIRRGYDTVFNLALTGAIAVTLMYAPVNDAIERATGFTDINSLATGSLSMLAFAFVRSAIIRAIVPKDEQSRPLHRGMMQTAVAITMYIVAFVCSLAAGSTKAAGAPGGSTDLGNHSDPGVFVLEMVLCVFLLVVAVDVTRACLKYIPSMTSRMFRWGFGSVALGCSFSSAAILAKIARQVIVVLQVDTGWSAVLQSLWSTGYNLGTLFVAVGLFLPAVSRPVARFQVVERYRLLRLQRMWRRAAGAAPALVNHRRPPLRGVLSKVPGDRLHRAVVEILDSEMSAGGVVSGQGDRRLVERAEKVLNS